MSKSNGKSNGQTPVATVQIIMAVDTGAMNIQHPADLVLTMHMLASAQQAVVKKINEVRTEQARTKVVTAPASAMRRLEP